MHDTAEVTALIHCSLLVVASSMGNGENLRLLATARTQLTQLPACDIFLAPSTIPESALQLFKICVLNYVVVSVISACRCTRMQVFKHCAYTAAVSIPIKLKFAP